MTSFFFFLSWHPRRFTLFPYTTLFRSDVRRAKCVSAGPETLETKASIVTCDRTGDDRSEEHTSELQSPYDLVCRLLLEKKNEKAAPTLDTSASAKAGKGTLAGTLQARS